MKTALVTGGNRGIGEGICRVLAERGYDIFFTYKGGIYDGEEQFRNEMEKAEALVQSICNEYNVKCFCKEADFTKEEDVEKIFHILHYSPAHEFLPFFLLRSGIFFPHPLL